MQMIILNFHNVYLDKNLIGFNFVSDIPYTGNQNESVHMNISDYYSF